MNTLSFEPKKAIAYYRTAAGGDLAIVEQKHQVEEFCTKHGIDLVYSESDVDVSGLAAAKPGLDRIVEAVCIHSTVYTYVVMTDPMRISRTLDGLMKHEQLFKKHGIQTLYVCRYSK